MKIEVDHESPIPLHVQVEQLLRELIKQPLYADGGFLPKEVELAKKLGVSRNTIRQATNKLENLGLIVRKKGVGTRVAVPKISTDLSEWHSFTQEMHYKGISFENLNTEIAWVKPKAAILEALGLKAGIEVLKLTRLKGLNQSPIVYFESYFHPRIGLTGKEDFTKPLYEIIEQDYHLVPSTSYERIKAVTAAGIYEKLNLQPTDLILLRERIVTDRGDKPLEYNIGHYRADQFTYEIAIKRPV